MNIVSDTNKSLIEAETPLRSIFTLQKYMLQLEQYDFNQHLRHTFSDGVYARELLIPKDIVIIGKVHRHAHLNIVSKGKAAVWTPDGIRLIDATNHPVTFESLPNTKRVVVALEDTVWTTIHLTKETDLAVIEEEIIIPESEYKDLLDSIPDDILSIMVNNKQIGNTL